MTTPILDFLRAYRESGTSRFHMPGHKGRGPLGCEGLDITEVAGADVLSHAGGIIAESEENATRLFGTAHTFYSTEGSTLAIRAMLALALADAKTGARPLVLAARNAHRAFMSAVALLDARVFWLDGKEDEHLCTATVTKEDVAAALGENPDAAAVYLTSPDYLGNIADITGIAEACHAAGVPLLVDNAHGAYLSFLEKPRHPIALGADMCADSAHKTLPVLTGGAYLHIAKGAREDYAARARAMLALFASTSPSYLILASLDAANASLAGEYPTRIATAAARLAEIRGATEARGFLTVGDEPLKLTLDATPLGYTGEALADYLRSAQIECEYADERYLVLMASADNDDADFARLARALDTLPVRTPLTLAPPPARGEREAVLSIRDAMLARAERVPLARALGRIAAAPTVSCPPAVPILVCGERVDDSAVRLLRYYGIYEIDTVVE